MQCPNCGTPLGAPTLSESDPPVFRCSGCQGVWVDSNAYLAWVAARPVEGAPDLTPDDTPVSDTQNLKLCPTCRRFLTRYHILPGARFSVERCAHCNGVWFDADEWVTAVRHRLHDKVNRLFTQPWQAQIRAAEAQRSLERLYLERFGAEDYARVRDVRAWLDHHPQRATLLAFLQARDPYTL